MRPTCQSKQNILEKSYLQNTVPCHNSPTCSASGTWCCSQLWLCNRPAADAPATSHHQPSCPSSLSCSPAGAGRAGMVGGGRLPAGTPLTACSLCWGRAQRCQLLLLSLQPRLRSGSVGWAGRGLRWGRRLWQGISELLPLATALGGLS